MKKILKNIKKVLTEAGISKEKSKKIRKEISKIITKMIQYDQSPEAISEVVQEIIEVAISEMNIENKSTKSTKSTKSKKDEKNVLRKVQDDEISTYQHKDKKFFVLDKNIIVKRYFVPIEEVVEKDKDIEGFCVVICTKKEEKRFLKIMKRQDINVYKANIMLMEDFVENEMVSYKSMNFSDNPSKSLNLLYTNCKVEK